VIFCLSLLATVSHGAARFVELTAEVETISWPGDEDSDGRPREARNRWIVRCVVGTNSWLIDPGFADRKETWCFTGTNIIHRYVQTRYPSKDQELYQRNHPEQIGIIGRQSTKVVEFSDGYPGKIDLLWKPGADDLWSPPIVRVAWLAFCSGSYLKRDGRTIPLPSVPFTRPFPYSDKTASFADGFGLPRSVELFATNTQQVLRYQVQQSTNVLGWNFPLKFELVQYRPARTTGWESHSKTSGQVTAIGIGAQLQIPTGSAVEK